MAPNPGGPGAGVAGDTALPVLRRLCPAAGARVGPRALVGGEDISRAGKPVRICRRLARFLGYRT
jgi:hypothetical protein